MLLEDIHKRSKTYKPWIFRFMGGTEITAHFTDQEVEQMKIKYPDVKWTHFHKC